MLCVCLCDWNQRCLTWTCSNWALEEICWADGYVTGSSPDNATGAHPYPWYTVTPARWVLLEHTHTLCHLPGQCYWGTPIPMIHCDTCQVSATGAHPYTVPSARSVLLGHTHTHDTLWHLPGECYWSTPIHCAICQVSATGAHTYPQYTVTLPGVHYWGMPRHWHLPGMHYWGTPIYCDTCQVNATGVHSYPQYTATPARCVILGHAHTRWHLPGECYWSTLTRARPYPWYTATCQVSATGAHLLGHAHTHDTLPPARCVLLGHIHLNIHCPTC